METDSRLCRACSTKRNMFLCSVCNEKLPFSRFPDSQIHHREDLTRNLYARCTGCHTCKKCEHPLDIHAFDEVSPICKRCNTKLVCAVCNAELPFSRFPDSQIHHRGDLTRNLYARCTGCHTCKKCEQPLDIHAFDEISPRGKRCNTKLMCDACREEKAADEFDHNILKKPKTIGDVDFAYVPVRKE